MQALLSYYLFQTGLTDQEKFIMNTKIDFARRDKERGTRDDDKYEDPVECTIVDDKIVEKKPIRSASIVSPFYYFELKFIFTNFTVSILMLGSHKVT